MTPEEKAKEVERIKRELKIRQIKERVGQQLEVEKGTLKKMGEGLVAPAKYVGGKILPELKSFISPFGEAKRLEKTLSTPKEQAQYIKEGLSLPLEIATLPGTMVSSSIMAGTGWDKKIGDKVKQIMDKYKLSPETMELLGLGTALVGGRLPIAKQTKTGIGGKVKAGKETSPGAVGEELIESAEKEVKRVKQEVYKPMREKIGAIKVNENIGKETSADIKNYINTLNKQGQITPQMKKSVLTIADDIANVKSMEVLLNKRRTYREQLKTEYPNNPDFVDVQRQNIDRIINDKIYSNINNPILKNNWKKANQAYGEMAKALDNFKKIPEGSAEKVFNKVLNGGTKQIESLKKLSGDEGVKKAGFNYIAEKTINLEGDFSAKAFKNTLKNIGKDKGKAIFGGEWDNLIKLADALSLAETPHKFVGAIPIVNLTGIQELIKFMEKGAINRMIDKPIVTNKATVAPYIAGETVEHLEKGEQ